MAVHIQLDRPHAYFTNLDIITGKAILTIFGEETISAINVKLESESRTRLAAPSQGGRRDKAQTELEVHKLLYKVQTVFPSAELLQQNPNNSSFTLPPGKHEYSFEFKIPFNNACSPNNSMFTNLNVSGARMEIARDSNSHVKKTLPPTLTGYPGEAEIRYFLKATVQRPAFYKENFRVTVPFKFLPIEPPRSAPNKRESYARRQHQFAPYMHPPQKQYIIRKQSTGSVQGPSPPIISVDGRLPDPAILTCNEPIPLRVLIKKLNDTSEIIFLRLLQIQLIGYTKIRAHELEREEASVWVIVSQAQLNIPLGNSNTPIEKDMEIDKKMWNTVSLPNSVPPSFETCNLSRNYVLEVKVGLSFGSPGNIKVIQLPQKCFFRANTVQPELSAQTLRMPAQVYSGITPSPALLAAFAKRAGQPDIGLKPPRNSEDRPINSLASPSRVAPSSRPTSTSTAFAAPSMDIPNDAPPSYEDAMAEELAPVDGPRREYHQPQAVPTGSDSKKGGLFGNSDRLFP
ncbi:hypothetical protein MMC13_005113 [Lambiella insularis]|nr:hypothetical protein [Lambiella insularis]